MITSYPTRAEFGAAVGGTLSGMPIDGRIREAVLAGILAADDELREAPDTGSDLRLRVGGWFLRPEDVPFVESIGATGALGASLAAGGALAPAVITAVTSAAAIAWRIWRRGGRLTHRQLLALTLLRERGPADRDTLAGLLAEHGDPVGPREVTDLLFDLQHSELADGTVVALVRAQGDRYAAARI
jgi:hypothetical protein